MTPRLYLAAAHKSSGKTLVTLGLARALRRRGAAVACFKKGPDFIDPMWLRQASGRDCFNLDFNTQRPAEMQSLLTQASASADITLIEGNKGLHDGLDPQGADANAALAKQLGAPVVMVIDTRGMTRSVAPLLLGFQAFDPAVQFAGVILNRVGGERHERKLRAALQTYTDLPVLGALPNCDALRIDERHLGLIPSHEHADAERCVDRIAQQIAQSVDLHALRAAAGQAAALPPTAAAPPPPAVAARPVRIAIARDTAFGFYYPDDLLGLARAGAQLAPFSPLRDRRLPDCDGLLIGGGFPETHLQPLHANTAIRHDIRQQLLHGLPAYAECGGLMYLCRSLRWRDRQADMVGVIPADVTLEPRPVGRGYVRIRQTDHHPWPAATQAPLAAHEFHHSRLSALPPDSRFAYHVARGHGIDGRHDGLLIHRLLASYAHLRSVAGNDWTQRFVAYVRRTARHRATGDRR